MTLSIVAAIGAFAIAACVIALVWMARRSERRRGAAEALRDHYRSNNRVASRANEIDETVRGLADSDLDRELRRRR